jgi:hypothetical protein
VNACCAVNERVKQEAADTPAAEDLIGFLVYLITGNTGNSRLPIFVRRDQKSETTGNATRSDA